MISPRNTNWIKNVIVALALIALAPLPSRAETLYLYDDTFTVSGLPSGFSSSLLSARWGVWSAGAFTQAVTSSAASGVLDFAAAPDELSVSLSQIDNSIYASGTQMALAIFANAPGDSSALNYNSSFIYQGIFTDPSWTAPSFGNNPSFVTRSFTANTTALVGGFTFSLSGSDAISLIPEPTSASLLLGASLVWLGTRRKKV